MNSKLLNKLYLKIFFSLFPHLKIRGRETDTERGEQTRRKKEGAVRKEKRDLSWFYW